MEWNQQPALAGHENTCITAEDHDPTGGDQAGLREVLRWAEEGPQIWRWRGRKAEKGSFGMLLGAPPL